MGEAMMGEGSSRAARRFAALALACLVPVAAQALMPMSPQLDSASRLGLVQSLAQAGISETGSSAVLRSLLAVLGTKPATRRHRYREPYPQLPDVNSSATAAGRDCSKVQLVARPKSGRPVAIDGVYCLTDPARFVWAARSLSVRAR